MAAGADREPPAAETRGHDSPEGDAVLADSVGLALLVVLETLSPPERLAFVLHDVFGVPFDEIAPIVERTPAATRQLASRARRRVQAEAPDPDADLVGPAAASSTRSWRRPGPATSRGSSGSSIPTSSSTSTAADTGRSPGRRSSARTRVAREVQRFGPRFASYARPAIVNGAAGIVVPDAPGQPPIVMGFTIRAGRIAELDLNGDPAKTARAIRDLG